MAHKMIYGTSRRAGGKLLTGVRHIFNVHTDILMFFPWQAELCEIHKR